MFAAIKKIFPFVFFLTFIYQTASGQLHIFSGKVIDSSTNLPIQNVNIQLLPGGKFGFITDNKGVFRITTNNDKVILKFSHLAYKTEIVELSQKRKPDSTFVIKLLHRDYLLDEVTIKEEKIQIVYKAPNQSVIDYAVFNNRIFFIIKNYINGRTSFLSVKTNFTDTIELTPPVRPKALKKDFYNNLDMISVQDSVYQIIMQNGKVTFLKPFSYDKLSKLQRLYKFRIGNKYYFTEFETNIQDKIKFGLISGNNKKKYFFTIYDENKVNYY